MQLIIFQEGNDNPVVVNVPDDGDVILLAQMIQLETGIPINQQYLEFNSVQLMQGRLVENGIVDGESILLRVNQPQQQQQQQTSSSQQPTNNSSVSDADYNISPNITPEALLQLAQTNGRLLRDLKYSDPEMCTVLETGDVLKVRQLMMHRYMRQHKVVFTRQQEYNEMLRDPDNPDLQKKLEEKVSYRHIT